MAATGGMSAPEVSVILPAYNREKTLRAAMDSVLSQQGPTLELIVVDDASADASAAVAEAHPDPRVRVIRLAANRGAAGARNAGIEVARAPWVAFQDSDDLWLPGKLAAQMARAAEGVVAVYCAMRIEDPDGVTRQKSRVIPGPGIAPREGEILPTLLRGNIVSTQTLMIRRELLQRLGGFDLAMPPMEDWELMIRVAQAGRVALVPEVMVIQHFSENSITRSRANRAASRKAIVARHAATFAADPQAHALQLYRIAGEARLLGDAEAARAHLAQAIRARPLWWRPHAMRVWLALRRLTG